MLLACFRIMGQRLCKADVPEKFLTPQGSLALEPSELRKIRKLVAKGKLAPFYPGVDDSLHHYELDECPICFLYHKTMNRSKCCGQRICSECFVQIKTSSGTYLGSVCPFCKSHGFNVEICGPKSEHEKVQERLDEQRLLEHRIKERVETEPSPPLEEEISEAAPEQVLHQAAQQVVRPAIDLPHHAEPIQEREDVVNEGGSANDSEDNMITEPLVGRQRGTDNQQLDSAGDGVEPTQDYYREEFTALGRTMTNRDMLRCAEYLGVFPEDLGMQVEDFNELLLEQAIINSMMENGQPNEQPQQRQQQQQQQQQQQPQPPQPPPPPLQQQSSSEQSTDQPPLNQDGHTEDNVDVRSWASDSTEPNWEFISLPRGSLVASSGWDRVSSDEEGTRGENTSQGSVVVQGEDERSLEESCRDACVASSSSTKFQLKNSDDGHSTECCLMMKTQDFGSDPIWRQASCPGKLDCRDEVQIHDVASESAEGVSGSVQSGIMTELAEPSTSMPEREWCDLAMLSSSSGSKECLPPRPSSCPLGNSETDLRGPEINWMELIAAAAMNGEVNPNQKILHLGMVFVHMDRSDIERIDEDDVGEPSEQNLDEAMDESDAGGDALETEDVQDSESEDTSMQSSERGSLASSLQDPDEASSQSASSEVHLSSSEQHNLEISQITMQRVDHSASKTIAVQNPDGSLVLVTVPDDPVSNSDMVQMAKEEAGEDQVDAAVQRAIAETDNRVVSATTQFDIDVVSASQRSDQDFIERMRQLDEQLKQQLQGGGQSSSSPNI